MRILITGAGGMLGSDLRTKLASNYEIVATGVESGLVRMDITQRDRVIEVVTNYSPQWIIHCAAYTDVDGCERNPIQSERLNYDGTVHIVTAAHALAVPLIFLSTDYVFDGCKTEPYNEEDHPNPTNIYGLHKYRSETAVRAKWPEHYIIRSAWLFGEHGNNFVNSVVDKARRGEPLSVVEDQIGSPTYARDLADVIARILETQPEFGTYHAVNSGSASRFELAEAALKAAGIEAPITAISSEEIAAPAKRPAYSVLNTDKLNGIGISLRSWQEALKEYVREI